MAMLACACTGPKELNEPGSVLVGTVLVVRNEPFTELSIQTKDHRTRIIQKDTSEMYRRLWHMQGQTLRIVYRPVISGTDSTQIILEHIEPVKDQD